jgi:radical SAM superfamily enzyme YgiQ (UPF0313 family)
MASSWTPSAKGVGESVNCRPVVLVQPPGACREFTRSGSSYPPLGLCQLAATVDESLVEVVDADGMGWSWDRAIAEVLARRPRMVGMTVTSFTTDLVERFASAVRVAEVTIVVGGPHASLAPIDTFERCPSVDYVVCGEGEVVFAELCDRTALGRRPDPLPCVWARSSPPPASETDVLQVSAVDRLPFPKLEGLPISAYSCPDARLHPMITMMTARGCPHRCGFCSSPTLLGRSIRGWSVDAILGELSRLQDEHEIREVSFVDDVFTILRHRTLALCRGMVERGLDLSWFCNARADRITQEIAEAMAAAGCHQVYLGFESGSQRILDAVKKGARVADLERGAAMLKAAGIDRSVGFVVGLPGETDETIDESIALAHRVRPERIQFTRFTPLPGSPLGAAASLTTETFHARGPDRVGAWLDRMYAACAQETWGRATW